MVGVDLLDGERKTHTGIRGHGYKSPPDDSPKSYTGIQQKK